MAPLLQPLECCLLLIEPTRQHLARLDQQGQQEQIRRYQRLERAANTVSVPLYFGLRGNLPPFQSLWAQSSTEATPCFSSVDSAGRWVNTILAAALASENRTNLILSGFWLEGNVTFAALNALADGFDVFVLLDLSLPSEGDAGPAAVQRLHQAGVVPSTSVQLIQEWAAVTADPAAREQLLALLLP